MLFKGDRAAAMGCKPKQASTLTQIHEDLAEIAIQLFLTYGGISLNRKSQQFDQSVPKALRELFIWLAAVRKDYIQKHWR